MIDSMKAFSTASNIRWTVDPNWVHTFYVFFRLDQADGQVLACKLIASHKTGISALTPVEMLGTGVTHMTYSCELDQLVYI